jgi:hypothetical protein
LGKNRRRLQCMASCDAESGRNSAAALITTSRFRLLYCCC